MQINIRKLDNKAIVPTRGSEYFAGYDLYANCLPDGYVVIEPHKTVKIGTGLSIDIPTGYFGAILARSGLAAQNGLRPANCIGGCDSACRGEYTVALHNDTDNMQVINHGDRIAQLVVIPYLNVDFTEVDELSDTERRAGGFGGVGK